MTTKIIIAVGVIITLALSITGVLVFHFTEKPSNLTSLSGNSTVSLMTEVAQFSAHVENQ